MKAVRSGLLRSNVLPWLVLACALLSTFSIAYYIRSKDRLRSDSADREAAQMARDRVRHRMDGYLALLRGAASLISNRLPDGTIQLPAYRQEWERYVELLDIGHNYPGVRGIGFAVRLDPDQKSAFEKAMRASGLKDYKTWTDVPADRSTHATDLYPLIYTAPPTATSLSSIGFDVFSDPERYAAMTHACDTASPSATGIVRLKQRAVEPYNGIIIYLPVYHTGPPPEGVERRRSEVGGFVFGGFRAGRVLDEIFSDGPAPIDFSLYDGDKLIDQTDEDTPGGQDPMLDTAPANVDREINVAGRTWNIRFRTHPRADLRLAPVIVPAVLILGSALSTLLFLLSRSDGRARLRAEQSASDLRESEARLQDANVSLRESETRLRAFTDSNIVGMLIGDISGRIHDANDAFLRLVGHSREDLAQDRLDWKRLTAPEYMPIVESAMRVIQRTGRIDPYEKEFVRSDDTRVPVLVGKAYLGGNDGRFVAFVLDISERKFAEASLRKSETQLRLVTDSLPALISYVDTSEIYRFANGQYQQWFGVPGGSIVGRSVRDVLGDKSYEQRKPFVAAALRGEAVRFDGPTPHRDGNVRETEISYIPDRGSDGVVRGFVALVSDVSEERHTAQALRRYGDLFQHAELGLIVTGADAATLEMANPAVARMCGVTPDQLANMPLIDLFAAEYRTEVPSHIRIAQERGNHTFESVGHRASGIRFPIEVNVTAVRGGDGAGVVYHILSVTDITERERTEAELRYQLHLTNTITANAADSLFLMDAQERITYMNPTAESRFGWRLEEVVGKSLYEIVRPGSAGTLGEDVRSGRTSRNHEDVFYCRDGSSVSVLCTNAPIQNADAVTGSVLVVHDITERKQAERDREQLLEAEQVARAQAEALARTAEDANRSKDEFLATLSHELRTPLNAMLGWAQLLRLGGLDPDESSQALETIERNARVQAQLIEDLLDLSRIISGKLRLDIGPVDLPSVIEAALDAVRPAAEAKGIRLIPVLDSHAGTIRGDANRLQQIVWNLLSNAMKFTPPGGQVQIDLTANDGQVEISVIDTGEGISTSFLPHVFDRLRQGDASITRKHGGLGLGLSIVRHLVELHGGTVAARSPGEGKGSTFTVRLPVSAPEQASHHARPRSDDRVEDELKPLPSLAGTTVLVVDDEPDARDLIARILRQCGASIVTASSAAEAANLISSRPDVLLSDIGMPGEDGYSLIRRVRALPEDQGGRTPAIALTAFARNEDRDRALGEGFQMHVVKPVEPATLAGAVAELLALGAAPREQAYNHDS